MDLVFGDDGDYGRGGLVIIAVGMGLYLAAATLNQAALARGHTVAASSLLGGCRRWASSPSWCSSRPTTASSRWRSPTPSPPRRCSGSALFVLFRRG